jgi:hypothetical protein
MSQSNIINIIDNNFVRASYNTRLNNINNIYNFINPTYNININDIYDINDRYINTINNRIINLYINITTPISTTITFTSDPKYIGTQCSICWENVENIETMAVTKCGDRPHVFHQQCINTWTQTSHTCPNCRTQL